MAATGAFLPTNYNFLQSRVIVQPKAPTLQPVAPTSTFPINRLPTSPTAPTGPIIKTVPPPTDTTPWMIPTQPIPAAPTGGGTTGGEQPAPTGTGTGGETGGGGGGGGSDLSRLMDLFGSVYAPRELTPQLAPTSVMETGTSDAGGGGNSTMIIVVLLLAGGGFAFYKFHNRKKAA